VISHFLVVLMVKNLFYNFFKRINVLCMNKIGFLFTRESLDRKFPRLYNMSFPKFIKVGRVVQSTGACLIFRRCLLGKLAGDCSKLLEIIHDVNLGWGWG
jgi:hypothetical protein